jgi:uncharacterized protein (TIGR03086 family)
MDALAAGVAVLERSISYALGSLSLVTPALLDRPTPCRRWELRDLLLHLDDSMAALQEAAESGEVGLAPADDSGAVVPAVRDRAVRLLGAWTNAGGPFTVRVEAAPMTAPLVAGAGAIEVTVHGWDVAQACGAARPIPDDLADELLDLAALMIRPADRPGRFARPLTVAPRAPAAVRLLAFLGRPVPA